jgi:hypothetical protein
MRHKIVTALVLGAMMVSTTAHAFPSGSTNFDKTKIYKDEWKKIVTCNKANSNMSYSGVLVTKMYDGSGEYDEDYKRSKMRFKGWNGSSYVLATTKEDDEKVAVKGSLKTAQLKPAYRAKGKSIQYWSKGNNPELDAYIVGTFYADAQ